MATSKKTAKATSRVKFRDLKVKKDARGGSSDVFVQIGGIKGNGGTSSSPVLLNSTVKFVSPIKLIGS
jgi:hypothetical protein